MPTVRITDMMQDHPVNASKPWDLSITKNVAAMFLTVILMLLFFTSLARHHKRNAHAPKGFNNILETLVIFVRDDIAIPQLGEKRYMKFMPFLLSVFFFIWITNLLGLLPGAANVTGNIAVTVSLGLFTLALILINGNKDFCAIILSDLLKIVGSKFPCKGILLIFI